MIIQLIIFLITSTGVGGEAWGGVAIIYLILLSLIGLSVDFVIQYLTKKQKAKNRHVLRNGIGLLLLIGLYYFFQNINRELIITIPNDYDKTVGIIYDFPDSDKLPVNILTLNSSIELLESGLIFTNSSIRKGDLSYTKFVTKSGEFISLTINGIWERRYSREIYINYKGTILTVRIINVGEEENGIEKIAECEKSIREQLKKYETQ